MSKTPEDTLRDAVESYTNQYDFWEAPDETYVNDKIIELIQSDAVREYHQSLQPKVDIDLIKLINNLKEWRKSTGDNSSSSMVYFLLSELKPYLQPPAPECDAVDFADYLLKKGFTRYPHKEGIWYSNEGWGVKKTSIQLYTEYKQSKTNSDE